MSKLYLPEAEKRSGHEAGLRCIRSCFYASGALRQAVLSLQLDLSCEQFSGQILARLRPNRAFLRPTQTKWVFFRTTKKPIGIMGLEWSRVV